MSQSQSVLSLHKADQVSSKYCFELADEETGQKLHLRRTFSQSFHDKLHPIKVL